MGDRPVAPSADAALCGGAGAARARALSLRLDAQMPQIEAEIRATLAALEGPTRPEIVHAIRLDVAREQGIAP